MTDKNSEEYHFGVSGRAIWLIHIVIGVFLTYVGYASLKHKILPDYIYIIIIILGVLAALYHAHIWTVDESK